jgi:alpha-mannosidase
MVAESAEIDHSDSLSGAIVSRGKLVDSVGTALALFTQRTSMKRNSRIVGLQIELTDVTHPFAADPWNSYCACRFAWPDAGSTVYRGVHDCRVATHAKRIETTSFVEIESGQLQTAVLTGGLPFHRLSGSRMLDSLLLVRGEATGSFRLGIGIDVAHSWRASQEILLPADESIEESPAPLQAAGWLVHVDAPNVSITHLSNIAEGGRIGGLRLRLLEMEGRRSRAQIRIFRTPSAAERIDLSGKLLEQLSIDGDNVAIEIGAYEWFGAEIRW